MSVCLIKSKDNTNTLTSGSSFNRVLDVTIGVSISALVQLYYSVSLFISMLKELLHTHVSGLWNMGSAVLEQKYFISN